MRELKIESPFPAVPPLSSDPSLKKPRTARLAKDLAPTERNPAKASLHPTAEVTAIPSPAGEASALNLPTDAMTETPKRRQRQTAQKAKPAASKAKKTPATALAKPNWDVSKQLILDRFRQLEQECTQIKTQAAELNQQSTAIQAEMAQLRTIAQQVTPAPSPPPMPTSAYRAKPMGRRDVVDTSKLSATEALEIDRPREPIAPPGRCAPSVGVPPVSSQIANPVPPISGKLLAIAHSAYGTTPPEAQLGGASGGRTPFRRPGSLRAWGQRGWRRLEQWWQTMPEARGAIAIDALALVFGAGALRLGLQGLVNTLPGLAGLTSLLMLLPIAWAIYLALFKPKANAVVIYRLVLITLGLLLGGKL